MDNLDRLGPVIILLVTAGLIVVMDLASRREPRGALTGIALLGLALAGLDTAWLISRDISGDAFSDTIVLDDFTLFFNFFFAGVAAYTVLASYEYLERLRGRAGEFLAFTLVIAAGAMIMAGANDLITLYVAIELTSISQYALAGFVRDSRSSEAGLKYLLLGATSSAILLYGFGLLYGLTGTTSITEIGAVVAEAEGDLRLAFLVGATAVAAGFGFKMALVPFQMWAPDVYQGSPTPVSAYLSVGSKAAGFAVTLRVFYTALGAESVSQDWANLFAALAAISMTVGNVMATRQTNIKRLLGYSTIAQAGNIAVGIAASLAANNEFDLAASGVLFYLIAYAFTNLGAFFAITAIVQRTGSEEITSFAGMMRRAPLLALALTVCLVSLTGLPPSAGFWAKIYVFKAAIDAGLVWLVLVGALNTAISAYYYLKVVRYMLSSDPETETPVRATPVVAGAVALAAVVVVLAGIVPTPLLEAAERAAAVFVVS